MVNNSLVLRVKMLGWRGEGVGKGESLKRPEGSDRIGEGAGGERENLQCPEDAGEER